MPASACPRNDANALPTAVSRVLADIARARHIPGMTLAVTSTDGLLYWGSVGRASLAPSVPAARETAWLWFSMSKIVTATAVLQLADTGRVDLDAPFRSYLPAYAGASTATVRQLLSHTAGMSNPLPLKWVGPVDGPEGDHALFEQLQQRILSPRGTPGGPARYSNLGYLALGQVVESAAGASFRQYVTDHVLRPAGMHSTGYRYQQEATAATGYVRAPRVADPLLRRMLPEGVVAERHGKQLGLRPFLVTSAAYGGLVGPVDDAARFAQLHLRNGEIDGQRLLSTSSAQEMRALRWRGKPFDHGLGWFRKPTRNSSGGPDYVEHWGAGAGFWNAMRLYPGDGLGGVVVANTTRTYDIDRLFTAVLEATS